MTEKKVLVYGSLNLDHVYSVDHFAGPGETIPARDMKVSCGGKGLNQAVAFAKAGAQTYLAGKTGSGGDLLRDTCREYGVHTDYLKSCSEPGGHAVIQVDAQGQNSIIIFGGTNQMQTEEEISRVLEQFGGGDFLILQNEINNLPYLIQRAHERGMEIVLNPSPWEESLRSCGLEQVSWLILNEVEAFQMTGEQDPHPRVYPGDLPGHAGGGRAHQREEDRRVRARGTGLRDGEYGRPAGEDEGEGGGTDPDLPSGKAEG